MLPTIGIKSDSRELILCVALSPDFRSVLHSEADVILAVDRDEIHHAVPEVGLVFRDGFFAFFENVSFAAHFTRISNDRLRIQ